MGAYPLPDPNNPSGPQLVARPPQTPATPSLIPNFFGQLAARLPTIAMSGQQAATASMVAPPSLPSAGLSGMAAVPDLGAPTSNVSVQSPSMARVAARDAYAAHGDGISNIPNPWLRGFAKVADVAGQIVAPNIERFVPGTVGNFNQHLAKANAQITTDQTQAQANAQLQDTQSQMQMRNSLSQLDLDKGYAALNPKPLPPQPGHIVMSPDGSAAGWADGDGNLHGLDDPAVPSGARQVAANMAAKPLKLAPGDEPLSAEEAQRLNGTWDGLASKHNLPKGQFAPGMTRSDANMTMQTLNNVVGKQQGDTHITVQVQGQQQREAAANQKNAPLDLSDPAMVANVQGVANGSLKLADVFGRSATTAQKGQFVAAVKAVKPDYNSGDHDIENKARAYYTGGGQGGQTLTAFNAAQNHLQILGQAADALNNGNVQLFNRLSNSYGTATGDQAPTDFNAVKNAVKGEVARALTGHVTVSEQAELDKDLNSDMSPGQVSGVSHKYISLIDGKKRAMQDNYTASQTGQPNFGGGGGKGGPAPDTHVWSAAGWQGAHPGQDVNAATKAAKSAGFQVVK